MFSKNNKISKRQMFRLLTYDLLGIGTLLLPSALAKESGKNGLVAILLGIGAGVLFCLLIGEVISLMKEGESYPACLKRCFGKILGTGILGYYGLYYLCLGGYVTYVFGHLMITDLLKNQSFYWIVAGILGLAVYGIAQGIEGRARIYEILFWILMAPLFIMLFLAARDVELPRLCPVYPTGDLKYQDLLIGGYYSFEVISLVSFALFLVPFAKKKKSVSRAGIRAVLFSGLVLVVLYGILQGIFGVKAMEKLEYPAVTLMSMIQIPGGFFQRQDALMVAIWFFTVFALLSSSMFYAVENLKEFTKGKKEKIWMLGVAILFFGIAVCCYRSAEFTELLHRLFLCVGTPLMVFIPFLTKLCLSFRKNGRKGKRVVGCALIFCSFLFLSGCSTTELENRNFPLAMGVDKKENFCYISYKFQNLSSVANGNADSPNSTDFYIEDKDFFTGISKYANESNKSMDYNHMKVLILSKTFIEDKQSLENFLSVCGKEDLISRNTLLFFADNAAEILALDKNLDTAIGSYLEEMVESREDYKLKDAVTLGDLYNDMANKEQLLLVPVLKDKGGIPIIDKFYAVSGGIPKGEVGINDAVLSYLSQGKLKKLAFTLEDGTAVSINRITVQGDFSRGEEVLYHNKIRLETVVEKEIEPGSREEKRIEKVLESLFMEQLVEADQRLLENLGIDVTNSFYKLGMGDRRKYEQYRGALEEYVKEMECEFEVEAIVLNERG